MILPSFPLFLIPFLDFRLIRKSWTLLSCLIGTPGSIWTQPFSLLVYYHFTFFYQSLCLLYMFSLSSASLGSLAAPILSTSTHCGKCNLSNTQDQYVPCFVAALLLFLFKHCHAPLPWIFRAYSCLCMCSCFLLLEIPFSFLLVQERHSVKHGSGILSLWSLLDWERVSPPSGVHILLSIHLTVILGYSQRIYCLHICLPCELSSQKCELWLSLHPQLNIWHMLSTS